jgi:ketosteroid isomerase-like protein
MTVREVDSGIVDALINATNGYDVDAALALFTPNAVIDDPSTGERFDGHPGIREYVERFFVGYHTVTKLLSVKSLDASRVRARVEFTGDFGHEIGRLDLTIDPAGLIARIDADLE